MQVYYLAKIRQQGSEISTNFDKVRFSRQCLHIGIGVLR